MRNRLRQGRGRPRHRGGRTKGPGRRKPAAGAARPRRSTPLCHFTGVPGGGGARRVAAGGGARPAPDVRRTGNRISASRRGAGVTAGLTGRPRGGRNNVRTTVS